MKNVYLFIFGLMITAASFTACDQQTSLQEYYVEKQNSSDFISLDLPSSIVSLNEDSSEETKEAMASIKKLNILAYKINDSNAEVYLAEFNKVKNILKNKKYSELIRMNHKGANVIVKYLGTDEAIDEIIILASDSKKGFALARVLGDKMRPEKMLKLVNNINDLDENHTAFSQIEGLLSTFN